MQSVYLTLMLHSELEESNGIIVGVSSIAGQSLCMRVHVCVCVCVCMHYCRFTYMNTVQYTVHHVLRALNW